MTFKVHIARKTESDLQDCFAYLREYNLEFADNTSNEINAFLFDKLPNIANLWNYFFITGAPYRAYLYKIGKRTQYWVVYYIHEEAETIEVLRFWQASQDPDRFSF